MEVTTQTVKILVLCAMFVCTFTFSVIPVKLMSAARRRQVGGRHGTQKYKNPISLLSCYAAGVFLATCMLDLYPQVRVKIADALDRSRIHTAFPVSDFAVIFGLFVILITEQLVLVYKERHTMKRNTLLASDEVAEDDELGDPSRVKRVNSTPREQVRMARQTGHSHSHNTFGNYDSISNGQTGVEQRPGFTNSEDEDHDEFVTRLQRSNSYQDPSSNSPLRSVMLLLALSLHSVFEGLAVGLQRSNSAVLQIFAALFLHKSILAFSLGLNLSQSELRLPTIIKSIFIFAITSPLGVGIGLAIVDFTRDSLEASLINGLLQGLACGTFLYVTFFEILPHEFNSDGHGPHRALKLLLLLLGYATISGILFLHPEVIKQACLNGT